MARRRDPAQRLATPRAADPRRISTPFRPDTFGRFAEGVARYLGTATYLIIQTVVIILWIVFNEVVQPFDEYPYQFLTLVLSMQASYAAPLILLAQNRQEDRDREALERDRDEARRTQQDTEYLARELASIRIALADVVTAEDLERAIERVAEATGRPRPKVKKKKSLDPAPAVEGVPTGDPATPLPDVAASPARGGDDEDDGDEDDTDEPASPS